MFAPDSRRAASGHAHTAHHVQETLVRDELSSHRSVLRTEEEWNCDLSFLACHLLCSRRYSHVVFWVPHQPAADCGEALYPCPGTYQEEKNRGCHNRIAPCVAPSSNNG